MPQDDDWKLAEKMAVVPETVQISRVPDGAGGFCVGIGIQTGPDAPGFTIRVKSADGFKNLMLRLVDVAIECWPSVAKDFRDANR